MPAILTHYSFIKDVFDNNHPDYPVVRLATQGPDVFFFYGFSLRFRKNRRQIILFGRYLHRNNIASIYDFLLDYAVNKKSDTLINFVKGLFAHYVVDRNVHPYVYYRCGFHEDHKLNKLFHYNHTQFEAIIDLLLTRKLNTFIKPKNSIKCPEDKVKLISEMFYELAKHLGYEGIKKNTYYQAYKDMRFVEKCIYSPHGIKRFLYKLFHINYAYYMSMPKNDNDIIKYDILNESHQEWFDAVNKASHHESVLDLLAVAKKEYQYIDKLIDNYKNGIEIANNLKSFVNNIDHTGFEVGAKKKYYKVYLEE